MDKLTRVESADAKGRRAVIMRKAETGSKVVTGSQGRAVSPETKVRVQVLSPLLRESVT